MMIHFAEKIQVRWADIDANRHLRHSVYYDYGATMRMQTLTEAGLSTKKLEELMIGPILFREEAIFKREILFEDQIKLTVELIKATQDYGRWSLRHQFLKDDNTLAAILTVDGAWIDLNKRKLAVPDEFVRNVFDQFPKAADFQLIVPQPKS
jgi:acyl-CoA thioester hydrolase